MYLILTPTHLIAEICKHPSYVRRQSNGVVILSDEEHADAIYSNDSDRFYPTKRLGYLCESHTLVEIDTVPPNVVSGYFFYHAGEFYTTEQNLAALAKSKAPEAASLAFVIMAQEGKFDDTTITEHAEQFPQWAYPIAYAASTIVSYGEKLYRCLQAHMSQADWTPAAAPSLWKEVGDPLEEYPAWSQPVGAYDAYQTGDRVMHDGKRWISVADNNVWEPGVYGWEEVAA